MTRAAAVTKGADNMVRILTAESAHAIEAKELPSALADLAKESSPVTWIHTELSPAVIQALDDMGLNEIAVKSLREGPERPRVEEFADHLYISLFSAEQAGEGAAVQAEVAASTAYGGLPRLQELRLFVGPKWLISLGRIAKPDYEILADRVRRQVFSRERGASFIVYHICEWLVESLQPALDSLDDRIDALEDQVVMGSDDGPMDELFNLKRDLVDLRRRVAPLRDVMQRLGAYGVLYVEPESEVYFRDVHDDVLRAIELLDTYRDILSSALDLHLSSVSNRLNRVMKQLAVVATIFMPLSFIVGFFGMNFTKFIPFENLAWFLVMFGLLLLSTVMMLIFSWKRR